MESNFETPEWARDAISTPNSAAKPAEPAPKDERSAKERADAAYRQAKEYAKTHCSDEGEFASFDSADFEDGPEPQSSRWDWVRLTMTADCLQTPMVRDWVGGDRGHEWPFRWVHLWGHERNYDAQTGVWHSEGRGSISIQEVREAVDNRIAELGIDDIQKFRALSFKDRMATLKVSASK